MEEILSLCKSFSENPTLEKHTREFFKSSESLMLVSPLEFPTLCWWLKRLLSKLPYPDPKFVSYFPWIELSLGTSLPEELFYSQLLILEEPFSNNVSVLEALLRRRISQGLKTVVFHVRPPTPYVEALLTLGVVRQVILTNSSDRVNRFKDLI